VEGGWVRPVPKIFLARNFFIDVFFKSGHSTYEKPISIFRISEKKESFMFLISVIFATNLNR